MSTTLTYGGVTLSLIDTRGISRKVVMNGADYVKTLWTFDVVAYVNPQAVTFDLAGEPAFPLETRGTNPVLTDIALRDWMLQPRRKLVYAGPGGTVLLRAPEINGAGEDGECDADGGPKPVSWDVLQISGSKLWVVRYVITTAVNEAWRFRETESVLVSSRYESDCDIDADGFETRTWRGRAVFRLDRLLELGARADDFRRYLAPPNANGFQRVIHHWSLSDDETTLSYVLADRQTAETITAAGVSRMEVSDMMMVGKPGGEAGWPGVVADFFKAAADRNALGLFGAFRHVVPHSQKTTVVKVWGYPSSTRRQLQTVAGRVGVICNLALLTRLAKLFLPTQELAVMHDKMGRYVEARLILIHGPLVTIAGIAPDPNLVFPADDEIGDVATATPGVCPKLPNDGGVRSTYLGSLITAALLDPYAVPAAVPDPPVRTNRTPP